MIAVAHKDLVRAMGRRRTSRSRRALLAVALLVLCVLFCLFGAVASAGAATPGAATPGAATPGFSAQALLGRHALLASPLSAAELFTLFGISPAQMAVEGATPGKPIAKSPLGTITTTKPTFKWSKARGRHHLPAARLQRQQAAAQEDRPQRSSPGRAARRCL